MRVRQTLLTVALLRAGGIPARARCGFTAYFVPGWYDDHWVAEYWDTSERRWIMVDAHGGEGDATVVLSENPKVGLAHWHGPRFGQRGS